MGRKRRQRRQSHGSAWHWKQTDCWYYTMPGTRKRLPLFGEDGERIRGVANKEAADLALAKEKLTWAENSTGTPSDNSQWLVARVCSEYIQYCQRGLENGTISKSHQRTTVALLNDFCRYCGRRLVAKLKKAHVQEWIESHSTWRSAATKRQAIAIVSAAFNRAEELHGIPNPLKGLKKPRAEPRLASLSSDDEKALYGATGECFGNFLFVAIHTGLRPFCELAKITADDVEQTERGMMWRVYASKTKKTRKIPVRPEVAELARRLIKTAPRGSGIPLLRNTRGNPWKSINGTNRFITLKKKLGWDKDAVKTRYSCYTCRHTFVHRMLSGYWTNGVGCSIETLAELIGDTPTTAFEHYGKQWSQYYQDPLWAAIGENTQANGKHKPKQTSSRKAASSRRKSGKSANRQKGQRKKRAAKRGN